ncbi:MAG: uroporphyrinogen decarboxylase family protein [Thermodesulfobacteriota bacterium]
MKKMTSVERVITALSLKEPDRVPTFDYHNKTLMNAILPGCTYEEFVEHMDLDAIIFFDKVDAWQYEVVSESPRIVRDQWGCLTRFTSETLGVPVEPVIKSEKDLDGYVPPDPDDPKRYVWLEKLVKRFKGDRAVCVVVTDVFDIAKESLLGDEAYFKAIIKNPELVDRVNEIVLNYNLGYLRNAIELGADIITISGDYAMTHQPFVSPRHTARFLTPSLKKQIDLAHSRNCLVTKHTDGNINPIIDLLLDTGINGLHPVDPMAGLDLGDYKQKYGDRLCLCGNVSVAATLSWEPVEKVRQEVKDCIRKAGYGGGYICMSSNSIHSKVKPENYIAMVQAIRDFGKYPLHLE